VSFPAKQKLVLDRQAGSGLQGPRGGERANRKPTVHGIATRGSATATIGRITDQDETTALDCGLGKSMLDRPRGGALVEVLTQRSYLQNRPRRGLRRSPHLEEPSVQAVSHCRSAGLRLGPARFARQ